MKLSLLVLSTLAAGVLAVPPGGGEDENHNSSQDITLPDIPLTPDEPGYKAEEDPANKPTPTSSSSATPSPTKTEAPKKSDEGDLFGKLIKNLPLADILHGI